MTKITPTIRLMTPEEVRMTQRINAGSVIDMLGVVIPIAAGRSDQVHIFKEDALLYVLNLNDRLEYAGIEVFDVTTGEEQESIFLENESKLKKYFGSKWRDAAPMKIAKKFREFLSHK